MGHAAFVVMHVAMLAIYPPSVIATLFAHAFFAAYEEDSVAREHNGD